MSDWRKADIRMTLPGDWWYYAGAIGALYRKPPILATATPPRGSPEMTFRVGKMTDDPYAPAVNQGEITLTGEGGYTQVYIRFATPETETFWTGDPLTGAGAVVVAFLRNMAAFARQWRQDAIGSTPDELIEFYYRARAGGSKITLKQLAENAGLNYGYLRQKKMEYDRAGGWGSKANKQPDKKTKE